MLSLFGVTVVHGVFPAHLSSFPTCMATVHTNNFSLSKSWHDYQALEQGSLARKNCQFFALLTSKCRTCQGKLARLYTGINILT